MLPKCSNNILDFDKLIAEGREKQKKQASEVSTVEENREEHTPQTSEVAHVEPAISATADKPPEPRIAWADPNPQDSAGEQPLPPLEDENNEEEPDSGIVVDNSDKQYESSLTELD